MFQPHRTSSRQRGMTLVEVVVSLALLVLLSLITIVGMVLHARMAQSNMTREQIADGARRLMEIANVGALDATVIRVDTGPAGPNTVLTLGHPDPTDSSKVIWTQLAFLDDDNTTSTIRDNRIVVRNTDTPMASTGDTLIRYCAPAGAGLFTLNSKSATPLVDISLRIGDQTYPPSAKDNAVTGKGYQSLLVTTSISQL